MDDADNLALASSFIPTAYTAQGAGSLATRHALVRSLLAQRRLPKEGWDEETIELVLRELAIMDSNNFVGAVGLGEREARVVCPLVRRRHMGFGHGIGRSGDVSAVQPKAAGSSIIVQLTNALLLEVFRVAGLTRVKSALLVPTATGMAIALTLSALRAQRKDAKYVVWPRIDQKSCLKAIVTAGFTPVVIEEAVDGDMLRTDVAALERVVAELGAANIVAVMTTTSCFAPRVPDDVVRVAELCARDGIPHVVNNAYGLQASRCCHVINEAMRVGRVDAFVQSTDKNLMVPVGGAIVASGNAEFVHRVSKTYAGRASMAPVMDVFMTLLHLGSAGWAALLKQRKAVAAHLRRRLEEWAAAHGERVLETPKNPISFAVTVDSVTEGADPTYFGSMLFSRGVSGTRVVKPGVKKEVCGISFDGYGAHTDAYPHAYFTAAAAIGLTEAEVDAFVERLDKTVRELRKQLAKQAKKIAKAAASVPPGGETAASAVGAGGAGGAGDTGVADVAGAAGVAASDAGSAAQ